MQFDELMDRLDSSEAIDSFVEGLTSSNVLYMVNSNPDVQVMSVLDENHLSMFVADTFGEGDNVIHLVVENNKKDDECTHFKLMLQGYHVATAKNYHLEKFLRDIKCKSVHCRCEKAIVVGMDGAFGRLVSVPANKCLGYVPELGTLVADEVYDTLGKCIPHELIWHVMKYLSHPVAEMMRDHIKYSHEECALWFGWLFETDYSWFQQDIPATGPL